MASHVSVTIELSPALQAYIDEHRRLIEESLLSAARKYELQDADRRLRKSLKGRIKSIDRRLAKMRTADGPRAIRLRD